MGQRVISRRVFVFFRVGRIDPVHLSAFEDRVGPKFRRTQRRSRVRSEVGIAGAASKYEHITAITRFNHAPLGEGIADLWDGEA